MSKKQSDIFGYVSRPRYRWIGEIFYVVCVIIVMLLLSYTLSHYVVTINVDAECLRHGWKDSRVDWRFRSYCIREENEYEITVPLRELTGEKQ